MKELITQIEKLNQDELKEIVKIAKSLRTNHFVYAHFDSDDKLFYVGQGTHNKQYKYQRASMKSLKSDEWKQCAENGYRYEIIDDNLTKSKATEIENLLIDDHYEILANKHRGYKVYQYDIDGTFEMEHNSSEEAASFNDSTYAKINGAIQYENVTSNKQFRRSTDVDDKSNIDKYINKLKRPVIQLKDGKVVGEYESTSEAAGAVGCNHSSISNNLNGYSKSAYGYQWEYKI